MHVVTPRYAAAAVVVSAVVLRRPTKEYTHPYSMVHHRLPTAGIEVAPHYHQLLEHRQLVGVLSGELISSRSSLNNPLLAIFPPEDVQTQFHVV